MNSQYGFIAKLTEKEIEELEALKRIRRVKHKPFSPDNTEDNTPAGVFSFEVSEESDEAIEVGLPSFEDEMDLFADDPDAMSADNNPDLIKSATLPIYADGESASGDTFPYGVKASWGGKDYSVDGDFAKGTYAFVVDTGVSATTGDLNLNSDWSRSWISGKRRCC